MDLIEIFKAGAHTDSSGDTREWTAKDLEEIASLYDPAKHEAPIVIGHPEHDSPAYGWVESLKVEGGKLLAKVKDVADEFKDWVGRGLYKKISIALYPDLSLRHVGFLGAMPPAVKGLKQAMFSEKPAWEIETDLGTLPNFSHGMNSNDKNWEVSPEVSIAAAPVPKDSERESNKGGIKMTVKEWFEKMKGLFAEAEKELSPTPISLIGAPLTPAPAPPLAAQFSEAEVNAKVEEAKRLAFAEVEKLKKEKAEAEAKVKEIETNARKAEITAFCEAQCKEGKLTPALRKIIEPVMVMVSNLPEASSTVQFAEGGPAVPAVKAIKDFLTELPKVVTFKEVAGGDGPNSGGSAAEKLSALTKQKMEAKKDLSYGAAFAEVQKENLELARELLAEVRPSKSS